MELFYQPKVSLASGSVVGFEALLRWNDPKRGLLAAGSFLPDLVDSPLETELDRWVLQAAIAQAGAWHHRSLTTDICINITAATLRSPDFVPYLRELLRENPDVSPTSLMLEVVESSALGKIQTIESVFEACRTMGIRIALDDFGTGHSSLTHFRRLPVDEIKIDRSFVRDMLSSPQDMAIVANVTQLGQAFGRSVVAEGVEDQETANSLQDLGCEVVQRFGIARPMPARNVIPWVRQQRSQGSVMAARAS